MDQSSMVMIVGGAFIFVGLVLFVMDRRESAAYRDRLMSKHDMVEFMTNWPPRWWLKALELGGVISVAVGVVLLGLGLILHWTS
jgi:hypothetical protein